MIYWKGLFPVTNKEYGTKRRKEYGDKNPRKPILYYIINSFNYCFIAILVFQFTKGI